MPDTQITPNVTILGFPVDVVQHVLWFFGDRTYGVEPGSFRSRLMLTVSAADVENREALRRAFPDLVRAMDFVQHETLGYEQLREQAALALQVAS